MNEWLLDILEELDPETHEPDAVDAEPVSQVEVDAS